MVTSPLTSGPTEEVAHFDAIEIVNRYWEDYQIDVSSYFKDWRQIRVYRCKETAYEFFHPFSLEGKEDLYKQFSKFNWYYLPWKWEHEKSLPYISEANSILEIGCGTGHFVETIKNKFPNKNVNGLEITTASNHSKSILNETVQEHGKNTMNKYDIVCSFQVLEHVADVSSFLHAAVDLVKPGGFLIISVPNNDSIFFRNKKGCLLNMPPHHMGLWNEKSLTSLTKNFPINLTAKYFEPIQQYHFTWFQNLIKASIYFPLLTRLLAKEVLLKNICKPLRFFFRGHSCLFVYTKHD